MTIVISGSAVCQNAGACAGQLGGANLHILGPAAEGAPLLAMVRLPIEPLQAADAGAWQRAGQWFGTVVRAGRAESFRLVSIDSTMTITGQVSQTGGAGDLMLARTSLVAGEVVNIGSARLAGAGGAGRISLRMSGSTETPPPKRQVFRVHWDSWFDVQTPAYPENLRLTRLPAYVDMVTLCFARPLFTYRSLADQVFDTTGLSFYGTGHQLKNVLDLLRLRQPQIRIALAVQQGGQLGFEPYDRNGWAGMTSSHYASIRKFADDLDIRHIDVDYECVSSSTDWRKHCYVNEQNRMWCYTDGEYARVVKAFRARFPRPKYKLAIDAYNTGAFFGPFAQMPPIGWNHGYAAVLAQDAEARAAIDSINVMSFDERPGYDPVRALEAYRYHFPEAEVLLGLRSGPPYGTDRKRSLAECLDFANATIKLSTAGLWLYSLQWDLGEPHGPYSETNPDANMMARLVAERFQLPNPAAPLVGPA